MGELVGIEIKGKVWYLDLIASMCIKDLKIVTDEKTY